MYELYVQLEIEVRSFSEAKNHKELFVTLCKVCNEYV